MSAPFRVFAAGCLLFPLFVESAVPVFDSARAFRYLETQCAFGPRNPGSPGHARCLAFLAEELGALGGKVELQPFSVGGKDGKQVTLTNIIARFGTQKSRILLCAHWDTRPWADQDPEPKKRSEPVLGANDGASGVAVLLELAQAFNKTLPQIGVDLVFFDGEDGGTQGADHTWCLGSRFFAENMKRPRPYYAVLVDMVGDKDLTLPMEANSLLYAPDLVRRIWRLAEQLRIPSFVSETGPLMIDDHLELLKVGIPAVDIIDFDYPYWHTTHDTVDKCSPASLADVGRLLLHLLYENP